MRQLTVLIISGNPTQTQSFHRHLEERGFRVFKMNQGEHVPEMLVQVQPHLALLDWDLPDLSALAIIRAIRVQPGFSRLPIILFGQQISAENKILSLEAGVDICLDGVVLPKELVARVRALLRRIDFSYHAGLYLGD